MSIDIYLSIYLSIYLAIYISLSLFTYIHIYTYIHTLTNIIGTFRGPLLRAPLIVSLHVLILTQASPAQRTVREIWCFPQPAGSPSLMYFLIFYSLM